MSARECEQVNPSQSFQKHLNDMDEILFDTWDGMFGDVEEYHVKGLIPFSLSVKGKTRYVM